jgi:hypothetical protein
MDYTTKVALNQYPHEDKLYIFGEDTLLSETELFGEASRIMDDLADTNSLMIHINQRPQSSSSKSRRTRDQTEDEEQEERNRVQKRYRTITHVM